MKALRAVGLTWLLLSLPAVALAQQPTQEGLDFFEKKIRPVLAEQCYRCHSAAAQKAGKLRGGLLLDSKAGWQNGGDSGPAVVPAQPGKSLLLQALKHVDLKMPPQGQLSAGVIADFEAWIKMGAPDPRTGTRTATTTVDFDRARREHWAFQLPVKTPLPTVKAAGWCRNDIDRFILARLEKAGLQPVALATKRDLIRRATFALLGLPPTPEEIDAFLRDSSPDAFARVVDRLLASPHYGERWGRYWLDIARYADDKALAASQPRPHSYRYREWVIRALNQDLPYDQFLRLQLAGDLLTEPADPFLRLAGLGFQGLGAEYHRGNFAAQVMADELDDRIDTLTRGVLGLTVACARCHDHKYDPIPTLDYYSLAAAYQGSTLTEIPAAPPEVVARFNAAQQKIKKTEQELTQWLQERGRAAGKTALLEIGRYLRAAWKVRVLRAQKKPHDEAATARAEKLQPYFLNRLLNYLQALEASKNSPLYQPWITTLGRARNAADVPDELRRWTEEFQQQVQVALQEHDRAGEGANRKPAPAGVALLKTLWLDGKAPFSVPIKEVVGLLPETERRTHATLQAKLDQDKKKAPPAPMMIHGIRGGGQAMRVHLRGNVERLGEEAPPGFLQILHPRTAPGRGKSSFTRLELANAIATPQNPLTARVQVNRVWQQHFGRGIVGTASNFGLLGERPTHPELLDTLAVRFMEAGWSTKWLHREIMLSATYQLSTASDPTNLARDVDNHLLWRMTARRLDLEAWRDAMLAVSGRLNRDIGGPSFNLNDAASVRRTVYAQVSRAVPNTMAALFDFPDANATSERRNVTTVPQQQLFLLNSPFLIENARALAARLAKAEPDQEKRIVLAYRLAFGRPPEETEQRVARDFLQLRPDSRDQLSAWEQLAQALLVANEFHWID